MLGRRRRVSLGSTRYGSPETGATTGDCPYKRAQGLVPAGGLGVSPNFLTTTKKAVRGLTQESLMMQQNAAGVWGVPQLLDYHQEGGQGVDARKPHDAAECCRGLGCPQVLCSPPKIGGQGVEKETASETAYTMDSMSRNGMTCCIVITMTLVDSPACLAGYLELGRN